MKNKINPVKDELVINWHLLEPCQLECHFCFAHWEKAELPLIFRDGKSSDALIKEIALFARQIKVPIRLSLAGGEPMLDKNIKKKINYAHKMGLSVSLITNGDLLTEDFIDEMSEKLSMIGVSVDSFDENTNRKIGRSRKNGKVPDYEKIKSFLQRAQTKNPKIKIKINTVVNQHNYDDDLQEGIKKINPHKWKVLRVLPAIEKSKSATITDEQFEVFRKKHQDVKSVTFEDNKDMENSYLMIDPFGRFFWNTPDAKYGYSEPIVKQNNGIKKALEEVGFDPYKFNKRYE